jgi:MFS family permease
MGQNWQYLFIIEGSLTIFLALVAFTLLPRSLTAARFLSKDEKHVGAFRLRKEFEIEKVAFSWSATLKPLLNWHTWLFGFMALCYGVAAATCSNFLPVSVFSAQDARMTTDASHRHSSRG